LRIAILWVVLTTGAGVFVAMLVALRRHRAHVTTSAQSKAAAEYVWTVVPWVIFALCVAPAVRLVLAAGEGDVCIDCHLADGIVQPAYPPIAKNQCIGMQPAVDPIRTVFNCG